VIKVFREEEEQPFWRHHTMVLLKVFSCFFRSIQNLLVTNFIRTISRVKVRIRVVASRFFAWRVRLDMSCVVMVVVFIILNAPSTHACLPARQPAKKSVAVVKNK
jgi:uncharacterized BrkB/YihY/UPF0761 family membrane protein